MKIIISPAKKMNVHTDLFECSSLPAFLPETELLADWIKTLSYPEAKKLWSCNDKIAELNYQRFHEMDLKRNLTPALLSYEGIQYQYMAPEVFSDKEWNYVQEHLRILSGFYGVLKPLDGVTPYRLEMQAKTDKVIPAFTGKPTAELTVNPSMEKPISLYTFWGEKLYGATKDESHTILNLASKEYSKAVEAYLQPEDTFVTCIFGEWIDGKIIQKGTQAKMARGEMVRFMAENRIENLEQIKEFSRLNYQFEESFSTKTEYVFLRKV